MIDNFDNRVIEIFGKADSGKSKFALSLLDKDDLTLYIDVDRKIYSKLKENIYLMLSDNIEEIYELLKEAINSIDVVIIDSLSMLKTKNYNMSTKENENMYNILLKIINLCKLYKKTLIIINQNRISNLENNTYYFNKLFKYYDIRINIENNIPNIIHYSNNNKERLNLLLK